MPKAQTELPGVEAPSIPAIEKAADAYRTVRDRRMKLLEDETALRDKLLETVKANAGKLTPNNEGELRYRYDDDLLVILSRGKDKVKVRREKADEDEEDE